MHRAPRRRPSFALALALVLALIAAPPGIGLRGGGPNGPFSTYLDPAFAGAPPGFPPDGLQNYGETGVDAHPLVDWDVLPVPPPEPADCDLPSPIEELFEPFLPAPHGLWLGSVLLKYDDGGNIVENPLQTPADFAAALRVPWLVTSPEGTAVREVRARSVTLPSGVQALILAPGTGTLDDFTLEANSPCAGYDQDALYWIQGTHGEPYLQNPLPWFEVENEHTSPLLEGEIGRLASWFRVGSVPLEALQRGMTVIVPEWDVGKRPLVSSLIQLIEIDRFLNGAGYLNAFTTSPTGAPLKHRNFISGGSYGGCVALWASLYLEWLFHGAVVRDCNPDLRQMFGFQEAYDFLRGQLVDNFVYDEGTLVKDAYMRMLVNDLEHGFGGPPGAGLVGVPVDLAGLSLLSTDHGNLHNLLAELTVPLVLVTGDEDYGMYTFFLQELAAVNPEVIELKTPKRGHPDVGLFEIWNQTNQVLGQLLAMPDIAGCTAPPVSPPAIDWQLLDPGGTTFSDSFHAPLLEVDRSPAVGSPGLSVARVTSGGWPALEVREGLGASGRVVVADQGNDGRLEVYASTARGDLVGLRIRTDLFGHATGTETLFRTPLAPLFGHAEVLRSGPSKLLALSRHGPLVELDLDPTTGVLSQTRPVLATAQLGRGLHSLRARGANRYSLLNDAGEALEVVGAGTTWSVLSRTRVEGGLTFLDPTGGSTGVYGSAHGFLKRYDFASPGHPQDPDDVGSFLAGPITALEPLGGVGPGGATHVGVVRATTWRIALFDAALQEVGALLECSGSPPRELDVLRVTPQRVDLLTSWDVLPAVADVDRPGILALLPGGNGSLYREAGPPEPRPGPTAKTLRQKLILRLQRVRALQALREGALPPLMAAASADTADELAPGTVVPGLGTAEGGAGCTIHDAQQRHVAFDAPVSAVERIPDGTPLLARDDLGGDVFQPEWLALLHSGAVVLLGSPLATPIPRQVLGKPFGSAYGLARLGNSSFVAIGPGDHAWAIDVEQGSVFLETDNSTGDDLAAPEWGDRAHLGGFVLGSCAFGLYDGGALLRTGAFAANPLLALACAETNPDDPQEDWGGVKVLAVDAASCTWQYADPSPVFRSDLLFSPTSTPRPAPVFGSEAGNAVAWADLRSDGTFDLVVGTHAGTVAWFENSLTAGFSASPTPTGMTHDLGSRILGIETADVDGDGEPEVLVGTEMDHDPELSTGQLTETGSVYVFDLQGDELALIASLPVGFGVYGLHYLKRPFADQRDYLVVGMAGGRFRILEVTTAPVGLVQRYESTFHAPNLGAFNAMESFQRTDGSVRLVMGSSGGVFAFDVGLASAPPVD